MPVHESEPHMKRVLSTWHLVAFGLAYINLMGIFILYGLATQMTQGMMALAFVIATLAMSLTAWSYAAMSRQFIAAGSVYTYVAKTFNPSSAFAVGWVVMLDYIVLPLLNFLLIGLYLHQLMPSVPQWIFSLMAMAVITGLAIKGVSESARLGSITTLLGVVFIAVFAGYLVVAITTDGQGVGSLFNLSGFFTPGAMSSPEAGFSSVLAACAILCLMFLGFDGITTFAEETRDPRSQVGKAIMFTCAIAGVVFIVVSYLMQLAWPEAWYQMQEPDIASTELIGRVAGPAMSIVFTVIFVAGCIGSGLSALSAGSRILYSMGRDGVLPRKLGVLHPRFKTPIIAILFISTIGVFSLFTSLMEISSIVNFGALIAFMAVNLCVIVQYRMRLKVKGPKSTVLYTVLPVTGLLVDFLIWISLDNTAQVIGLIWTVLGLIVIGIVSRGLRRPMRILSDV
ncbi:APC family permease [Mycolicibacterium boenickei]